mmetsp:Transcript_19880/g.46599  ORF Transcript_19880/g.46599 Transcript_19880/m.46599 type:complete len:235 (+) Transcript_19880:951-1655(+)
MMSSCCGSSSSPTSLPTRESDIPDDVDMTTSPVIRSPKTSSRLLSSSFDFSPGDSCSGVLTSAEFISDDPASGEGSFSTDVFVSSLRSSSEDFGVAHEWSLSSSFTPSGSWHSFLVPCVSPALSSGSLASSAKLEFSIFSEKNLVCMFREYLALNSSDPFSFVAAILGDVGEKFWFDSLLDLEYGLLLNLRRSCLKCCRWRIGDIVLILASSFAASTSSGSSLRADRIPPPSSD